MQIKISLNFLLLSLLSLISLSILYSIDIEHASASSNGSYWVSGSASAEWVGRSSHQALTFDNKMWVLGGTSENCPDVQGYLCSDVWYSSDGMNWIEATSSAPWQGRRDFSTLNFDNKMWVLGGYSEDPLNERNDVWYSPKVNTPPILTPIGNRVVYEGDLLEFTVSATDPDGDNLTYSATNIPTGASFNETTGVFTWYTTYDNAGNYLDVEFTVMDNGEPMMLDVELITITVGNVNRAPIITSPGSQNIIEGELLNFVVSSNDPDSDDVTLFASNTPSGAIFSTTTGNFSWIPSLTQEGVYVVTFIAVDNGSPQETSFIEVVITVGDNPTPVEQTDDLVDTVVNIDIPQNSENSYLANLRKVARFIEDGKIQAALNQLQAFINKLNQDYQQDLISQMDYNDLLTAANNLIDDLEDQ